MSTVPGSHAFDPERSAPEAFQFLSAWFADEEADEMSDGEIIRNYAATVDGKTIARVAEQISGLAEQESFSHDLLADITNLHFENEADGRAWLNDIAAMLTDAGG